MKTTIQRAMDIGLSPEEINQAIEKHNKKYPNFMQILPKSEWPEMDVVTRKPIEVYRSRSFLAQIYDETPKAYRRISVCRTSIQDTGRWDENISWDELMKIKKEVGMGDLWACELYPSESSIVNVANMRHLWVFSSPPEFGWYRGEK